MYVCMCSAHEKLTWLLQYWVWKTKQRIIHPRMSLCKHDVGCHAILVSPVICSQKIHILFRERGSCSYGRTDGFFNKSYLMAPLETGFWKPGLERWKNIHRSDLRCKSFRSNGYFAHVFYFREAKTYFFGQNDVIMTSLHSTKTGQSNNLVFVKMWSLEL